ncbi:hypothetical protein ACWED2_13270 [Amycolatopsis sp. NPDC005003]
MNLFRSRRAIAVLALGVASCSTPAAPEVPSTTSQPTTAEPAPPSPGTEPSGPEAPRTGDHGVAISVPELPIGGKADPAGAGKLCATASWLQPEALPDSGVTVTRIRIDPPAGYRVGGRCGGLPGCASFTFRPGAGQCSVTITGPGTTDDAQLEFAGRFSCAAGLESSCRALKDRMNPGAIDVHPPEETTPEEKTTEPAPTTTEAPTSSSG